MTPEEAGQYLYNAGFRGTALVEGIAFGTIESNLNPSAVSSSGCIGFMQICGTNVTGDLKDPNVNAKAAYAKWSSCNGGSFACDWTPYDGGTSNPRWSQAYGAALAAVASLGFSSSSSSSVSSSGSSNDCSCDSNTSSVNPLDQIACALTHAWCTIEADLAKAALVFVGLVVVSVALFMLVQSSPTVRRGEKLAATAAVLK